MTLRDTVRSSKASIDKADLELAFRLMSTPIEYVLEIGTWKGYSALVWAEELRPRKLVTIEKDKRPEDALVVDNNPKYNYWWEEDSNNPSVVEAVESVFTRGIDLLFIDGDHMAPGFVADFENYSRLVRSGGYILCHDTLLVGNETVQIHEVLPQIKEKYGYPFVDIKGSPDSSGMTLFFK